MISLNVKCVNMNARIIAYRIRNGADFFLFYSKLVKPIVLNKCLIQSIQTIFSTRISKHASDFHIW